jgi:hypothetical protein
MPGRKAKPPRLHYRRDEDRWIILDRGRQISTGGRRDEIQKAADALTEYLGSRHKPAVGTRNPAALPIADVLTAYEERKRPRGFTEERRPGERDDIRRHRERIVQLDTLNVFFGASNVADVKSQLCRDFVDWRTGTTNERNRARGLPTRRAVSEATARRELEDLRAAIRAYHADHVLEAVPTVTMPDKSPGRDEWLTRHKAARLLGAALGFVWDTDRKRWKRNNRGLVRRDRSTRTRRRAAARFILIGLYSGRREATIRRSEWFTTVAAPWFDLDAMVYHGKGREERKTKKRRPPAKIAHRLRPHLLRWARLDREQSEKQGRTVRHVIHKGDGTPFADKIKTAWDGIVTDAGLEDDDILRHTLRHTAATWVMQSGPADLWKAAGWLGMTVDQLEEGYAHHHPDFQEEAASAFGGRR